MIRKDDTPVPPVSWEEFSSQATIEEKFHNEWLVRYGDSIFEVSYDCYLIYPPALAGASAFRVKKIEKGKTPEGFNYERDMWDIHVKTDLRGDWPDAEILRVVWCHLGRTEGDYWNTLYEYDRLDKTRPEGAIGHPVELEEGKVKRWQIARRSSLIHKSYIYITSDGESLGDVILIETGSGECLWETNALNQYESLREAEEEILQRLP